MKLKLQAVLPAAVLVLLLCQGGTVRAQTDDTTTTTVAQLKGDQRKFTEFLREGENEYENATNRQAVGNLLWVNNLGKALAWVKINLTLMDGNGYIQSEANKIANLHSVLLTGTRIDSFSAAYHALRNKTYDLQNKLNPLKDKLTDKEREAIDELLAKIGNATTASAVVSTGNTEIQRIQNNEDNGKPIENRPPGPGENPTSEPGPPYDDPSGGNVASIIAHPNDNTAINNFKHSIKTGPDPMSEDDADLAVQYVQTKNLAGLEQLVAKYPNNPVLLSLKDQMLAVVHPDMGPDQRRDDIEAVRHHRPIPKEISDLYPDIVDRHPHPWDGPTPEPDPGPTPAPGQDGFDVAGEWSPEEQAHGRIVAHYLGAKGSLVQISTEKLYKYPEKTLADEIDWGFSIKEDKRVQASDGAYTVTYELVNDGTPADAEFEVTAWEGPDGKTPSTEKVHDVTLKPGDTVKVYGKTTKYHHSFIISLTAN